MHANGFIESWKGFLKSINLRFGPSMYEDARGALSKLQQTSTVAIYQAQFEESSLIMKSHLANSWVYRFLMFSYIKVCVYIYTPPIYFRVHKSSD